MWKALTGLIDGFFRSVNALFYQKAEPFRLVERLPQVVIDATPTPLIDNPKVEPIPLVGRRGIPLADNELNRWVASELSSKEV